MLAADEAPKCFESKRNKNECCIHTILINLEYLPEEEMRFELPEEDAISCLISLTAVVNASTLSMSCFNISYGKRGYEQEVSSPSMRLALVKSGVDCV